MLIEDAEDLNHGNLVPDLANIREAGTHLLVLINDILDLSKIEAGKMKLYLETFNVSLLIDHVVSTIHPLVDKNDNELIVHCADNLGSMHADQAKVRQALFNLLSNAAKFTEQGKVTLAVTRESTSGQDWLKFRVTDTGIGMTQEQMQNLFKAFSQADASTTRKYGGTGLGLAISHRLCRIMGGEIKVESELEKGSTFTICLPAEVKELNVNSKLKTV
jgi:signal transduction histidine kinase